jgi:hypothetical protein
MSYYQSLDRLLDVAKTNITQLEKQVAQRTERISTLSKAIQYIEELEVKVWKLENEKTEREREDGFEAWAKYQGYTKNTIQNESYSSS